MLKLAFGFAISSALLCTACDDDYSWADEFHTGTAIFDVPSSDGFALAAEVELARREAAAEVFQVTIAEASSRVQIELPPGSYSGELTSFTLFREGEPLAAAAVTFVGFEPDPIVITPLASTHVALIFRELESGAEISPSGAPPRLVVNRGCSPGCAAAQTCADVNGSGASCYATCDDDTPCADTNLRCVIPAGASSGLCL